MPRRRDRHWYETTGKTLESRRSVDQDESLKRVMGVNFNPGERASGTGPNLRIREGKVAELCRGSRLLATAACIPH
jgi:hypothetical protein